MSIFAEKRNGVLTGRWIVEVTFNGKRHKGAFDKASDARRQEKLWKSGVNESLAGPAQTDGAMSLEAFSDKARINWKGQRDELQTCKRFETACAEIALILKAARKPLTVASVSYGDLETFKARMQAKGLSNASVNRYLRTLTKALKWAAKRDLCAPPLAVENLPEAKPDFYVLSDADEANIKAKLTEAGRDDILLLAEVQLVTGTRIGELVGCTVKGKVKAPLKASQVKLEREYATLELKDTKNGEDRHVPLPLELGQSLKSLIENGRLPSYVSTRKALVKARKALGLPTRQPTHAHRHTVVTRLLLEGEPDLVVQRYVGHKSLKTTERYFHMKTDEKADAMRRLMDRKRA